MVNAFFCVSHDYGNGSSMSSISLPVFVVDHRDERESAPHFVDVKEEKRRRKEGVPGNEIDCSFLNRRAK